MTEFMLKIDELRTLNDRLAENMETNVENWNNLTQDVKRCKVKITFLMLSAL